MINKKGSSLAKRYATSYQTKDNGGNNITRVINFPADTEFFTPQEGRNTVSIVPYTIKTDKHPLVRNKTLEVGDMDYIMDVWEHRGVGPTQANVLCLQHTYGKPCPICEEANRLKKEGHDEEAKALKAKRRVYYNVLDPKDDKVKVFATSHYLFEKELIEEARDDDEGGYIDFADPEEGKDVRFRANKTSFQKQEYFEYKSFSFVDRKAPLSKHTLEEAISFDEYLDVPTYDRVEKVLYGSDNDDDEDDLDEGKGDLPVVVDDDEYDAQSRKSKAEPKRSQSKSKAKVKEDDDADDDSVPFDVDEDDAPKKGRCPYGYKFGKDNDKHDECDDCDVWNDCYTSK